MILSCKLPVYCSCSNADSMDPTAFKLTIHWLAVALELCAPRFYLLSTLAPAAVHFPFVLATVSAV